jgi:hypothetical protein
MNDLSVFIFANVAPATAKKNTANIKTDKSFIEAKFSVLGLVLLYL